jgi:hypothetical protein
MSRDTTVNTFVFSRACRVGALVLSFTVAGAAENPAQIADREAVRAATLAPFQGPTERGVDPSALTGKVMCGYQGWFNCEGDGAKRGWTHWTKANGTPSPANIKVDLWPDLSEFGAAERYDTEFKHADGQVAQLFSSYNKATIDRHFDWMRTYGIDGVFVQRFAVEVNSATVLRHSNTVLGNCRAAANRTGRTYVVMYDLTGLGEGKMDQVIDDWRSLRTRMKIGEDPAYLHHRGKPLVAVWGIGFSDHRAYTLAECRKLVEFLKNDPEAGGCAVMLGVPTYWREQTRDAVSAPALHEMIAMADVISPWTVGRYGNVAGVEKHAATVLKPDLAWCAEKKIDYLPVLFPGFSWHNMYPAAKPNSIPRLGGEFYWSQFQQFKRAGANMLYVAMFDEVDEATAIFKCTNDVPKVEGAEFISYEGLPSDYYLRLTGAGAKILRGEVPVDSAKPKP